MPTLHSTDKESYEALTQLSAQFLCTCQIINDEALSILYLENTLEIKCRLSINRFRCEVLRSAIHSWPVAILATDTTKITLLDIAKDDLEWEFSDADEDDSTPSDDSYNSDVEEDGRAWLVNNYVNLKRFQYFHIDLLFECEEQVMFVCHAFQDLLVGKDVTIAPHFTYDDCDYITDDRKAEMRSLSLSTFKYLRCETFAIQGWPDVKDICDIVMGQTPIPLLLPHYVSFKQYLRRFPGRVDRRFPDDGDRDFSCENKNGLKKLSNYVVDPQPRRFAKKMAALAERAER